MKAKKLLLMNVLILALLAVALIMPATALGGDANGPVSWVNGNCNTNGISLAYGYHIGFTVGVQQGADLTDVEGFVLQKIMLTSDPAFQDAPVVRRATEFWPENEPFPGFWSAVGLEDIYLENYARFQTG